MDAAPGQYVTPTLRLVSQLGTGGMGSVWIADHLSLQTRVAVKFMAREFATNVDLRARFAREAAAASQVKSPHVVQMLDHGLTAEGVPFIAMELLEGEDIAHRVARLGRMPLPQIALIVTQVAKALSRAHERGIVHRDIKPENIFLCETGDEEVFVKLLDFGIAKGGESLSSATKTGSVIGTAYYMSPEQIIGAKNIDHRSDLWSLGVVVFELLAGARPFTGESVGALALAIHGTPPRPSAIAPNLSPAIDAWFAKACALNVDQRFGTAKELAKAFAAAVGEAESTGALTVAPNFPSTVEAPAYQAAYQQRAASSSWGGAPAPSLRPPSDPSGGWNAPPQAPRPTDPNARSSTTTPHTQPSQMQSAVLVPTGVPTRPPIALMVILALVLVGGGLAAFAFFSSSGGNAPAHDDESSAGTSSSEKDDKPKKPKAKSEPSDQDESDHPSKPAVSDKPAAIDAGAPPVVLTKPPVVTVKPPTTPPQPHADKPLKTDPTTKKTSDEPPIQ